MTIRLRGGLRFVAGNIGLLASLDIPAEFDTGQSNSDNLLYNTVFGISVGLHPSPQNGDLIEILLTDTGSFAGTPDTVTALDPIGAGGLRFLTNVIAAGANWSAAGRVSRGVSIGGLTAPLPFVIDTTIPVITSITVASTPAVGDTYGTGENIDIKATFDAPIYVDDSPRIIIDCGGFQKIASYFSGSGTTEIIFRYTVLLNNVDADGISIPANFLFINNGALRSLAGINANLDHAALATQSSHKVRAPSVAVEYIDSVSAAGTGAGFAVATTGAMDTTGATFLVAVVNRHSSFTPTLTDSKGNTWVAYGGIYNGSVSTFSMYRCVGPTNVGAGHTFQASNANNVSIAVAAYKGTHPVPVDQSATAFGSGNPSTAGITPSVPDALCVFGAGSESAANFNSVNDGYTIRESVPATGDYRGVALADRIQTTAVFTDPTFTMSSGIQYSARLVSVKKS